MHTQYTNTGTGNTQDHSPPYLVAAVQEEGHSRTRSSVRYGSQSHTGSHTPEAKSQAARRHTDSHALPFTLIGCLKAKAAPRTNENTARHLLREG